ncbi:MAG: aspartate carbamoyltransferase catalytic subunit, partial [Kiritimatiellia bacterium]
PINLKISDFSYNERMRHVILSAQYDLKTLNRLIRTADRIRALAKSKEGSLFLNSLLSHKKALLYFTQPSTRTFLSFAAACQTLGMSIQSIQDVSLSSESKGETPFDSVRMFSSYYDMVIMRSVTPNLAECCAYMMNELSRESRRNIPIINAGAGADEHPTQALLDIYTIERAMSFYSPKDSSKGTLYDQYRMQHPELTKGLDGKTIGFCGDIRRGRTVRSLITLLAKYKNVKLYFVTAKHDMLALSNEMKDRLLQQFDEVREFESFEDDLDGKPMINRLDCLYMTRIQKEHNSPNLAEDFRQIDFSKYKLSKERVAMMRDHAAILHPFPRDSEFGEIPTEIDNDKRSHYFRQARNGMWARAALISHIFDVDGAIADFYDAYTLDKKDYNESVLR